MKVLLVLGFIYINYVICFNEKKYPKKVNIDRNIRILNSKTMKLDPTKLHTKKKYDDKEITYFSHPVVNKKVLINVPDSPYFPLIENFEDKSRIKRVLPEYVAGLRRRKRSPNDNKAAAVPKKGDKKEVKTAKTVVSSLGKNNKNAATTQTNVGQKVKKVVKKVKPTLDRKAKVRRAKPTTRNSGKKSKLRKGKRKVAKRSRSSKNVIKSKNVKSYKRSGPKSKTTVKKIKAEASKTNVTKVSGRRLIAARDALIEDYPYVVSIQKDGQHWCSGALLNQRLVITTANCLWKSNKISRMTVRIGAQHADFGGKIVKISEIMKHPQWSIRKNPDNDVALLLMDESIRFSHKIHGVDLPNRVMLPAFDDAWVASYGADRRDGIYSTGRSLQVYHARLMDRSECNNITSNFGIGVTNNFICIAQTGRLAPCTRDTGAPAVSDGVIWGVASWGIRKLCGTERFPAMFSYLASPSNMDFILNATRILMAEGRHYPYPDRFPILRAHTTTVTTLLDPW